MSQNQKPDQRPDQQQQGNARSPDSSKAVARSPASSSSRIAQDRAVSRVAKAVRTRTARRKTPQDWPRREAGPFYLARQPRDA